MKKSTIDKMLLATFATSLYILVFKGFGFPNIPPLLDYILRALVAWCVQIFFILHFRTIWIRMVPGALSALWMLLGGIPLIKGSWQVGFSIYFAEYCTPFLGCCFAWLISRTKPARN